MTGSFEPLPDWLVDGGYNTVLKTVQCLDGAEHSIGDTHVDRLILFVRVLGG